MIRPDVQPPNVEDIPVLLYVERTTNLIYEIQGFDDFVLARPVTRALASMIRKMSYNDLAREFTEYLGNPQEVWSQV